MKKRIIGIVLLLSVLFLIGCYTEEMRRYTGDYPELYSIAIHSLLGAWGYWNAGSAIWEAEVTVLEEDDYGRILFLYLEPMIGGIFISQKTTDTHAYFYPHYHFVMYPESYWSVTFPRSQNPLKEDQIEELKYLNDWNQPIDESRLIRVPIVDKKDRYGPIYDGDIIRRLFRDATGYPAFTAGRVVYLNSDNYGRMLYYVRAWSQALGTASGRVFLFILGPDKSYDFEKGFMELPKDYHFSYQSILRKFKELNGWNTPFNP